MFRRWLVWLLLVTILVAVPGCGTNGEALRADDADPHAGSAAEDHDWSAGTWEPLPPPPQGVSSLGPIVWTGEELIVWGSPAAAYRPSDRSWRSLPTAPIADRHAPVMVWTGEEVVFWGGGAPDRADQPFADGAAYNPQSNSWRVIAPSPLAARTGAMADVVGDKIVVWGGVTTCCPVDSVIHDPSAARYEPATDGWSRLAPVPQPWSGDDGPAVTMADEDEMYVFRRQQLGVYDPAEDEWRDLPRPEVPESRCFVTGGPAAVAERIGGMVFTWSGGCAPEHGLAFDTQRRTWTTTERAPSAEAGTVRSTSGDGTVFLLTSGTSAPSGAPRAHAYSPSRDEWFDLPPIPDGAIGLGAELVWAGSQLLAWGGWRDTADSPTGLSYTGS